MDTILVCFIMQLHTLSSPPPCLEPVPLWETSCSRGFATKTSVFSGFYLLKNPSMGYIPACSPSNTNIVIDARVPGEITTPEFPDGSPDTSCTWKIQAQENSRLEITIKDLKLPGVDDYLIIRDGAEEGSPLIGKYGPCASGSLTLFSTGNSAFLQMVSSEYTVNGKLRIAFKPTDSGKLIK